MNWKWWSGVQKMKLQLGMLRSESRSQSDVDWNGDKDLQAKSIQKMVKHCRKQHSSHV